MKTDHLIPARSDLVIITKITKRKCLVNLAVQVDYRVKTKESEMRDKYLDLDREQRKLWSMTVTVIPNANSKLGTVSKDI